LHRRRTPGDRHPTLRTVRPTTARRRRARGDRRVRRHDGRGARERRAGHAVARTLTPPRVVLASSSPRRRELLTLIGIPHVVLPADIDEAPYPNELPPVHAERLAREKAAVIAARETDAVVVAADTIVVVDGEILGKPRDEADAAVMLRRLSGRAHVVLTAVAVAREQTVVSGVESVDVTFRHLSDDEIGRYIATREPMDKAGAYGIQG